MNIDLLLRYVKDGLYIRDIADKLNVDDSTVRYHLKKLSINYKPGRASKYDLSKILDESNVDGQYVIGLLAADGYIDKTSINIFIQERDIELLERVCLTLDISTDRIHSRVNSVGSRQVGLCIGCKELTNLLVNTYGFCRNKSRTLPFPSHLKNPMPFIRGFFDGDGYAGKTCTFTCGSKSFSTGLMYWINNKFNCKPCIQFVGKNKDIYNIHYRKRDLSFISELLKYKGLKRKTDKLNQYFLNKTG